MGLVLMKCLEGWAGGWVMMGGGWVDGWMDGWVGVGR